MEDGRETVEGEAARFQFTRVCIHIYIYIYLSVLLYLSILLYLCSYVSIPRYRPSVEEEKNEWGFGVFWFSGTRFHPEIELRTGFLRNARKGKCQIGRRRDLMIGV